MKHGQIVVLSTLLASATFVAGFGWLLWGIFGLLFIPKFLWFFGGVIALAAVIIYGCIRVENTAQRPTQENSRTWRGPQ